MPLWLITAALLAAWPLAGLARGRAGDLAPAFQLEPLNGGAFSSQQLRGKPAILVVGRSRKAAPPCRDWVLGMLARHRLKLPVYQVIVVDKSWYLPRTLVLRMVKEFVPDNLRGRALLEWKTTFADLFGIPKGDEPTLLVLGADSVIRWRHQGPPTASGYQRLAEVLAALGGQPRAQGQPTPEHGG